MDLQTLEERLAQLPLMSWNLIPPGDLEFSHRVRTVCRDHCPMYGRTWACPPGVGTVEECRDRCLDFRHCLVISTAAEVSYIGNMHECLATRGPHEAVTDQVREILAELGAEPLVLSSQACAICSQCTYPQGAPCRHPEKMHPCVESHGINLIPTLEALDLAYADDPQQVNWFSLLFF